MLRRLISSLRSAFLGTCTAWIVLIPAQLIAQPAVDLHVAQYQVLEVGPARADDAVPSHTVEPGDEQEPTALESAPLPESPFVWTISLTDEGLLMAGDVPAEAFQRYLAVKARTILADESNVRAGAPEGFVTDALAALDSVALLEQGRAGLDETGWFVEGVLRDQQSRSALDTILQSAFTNADEWRLSVHKPLASAAAEQSEDVAEDSLDENQEGQLDQDVVMGSDQIESSAQEPEFQPIATESDAVDELDQVESEQMAELEEQASEPVVHPDYVFSAVKGPEGIIALNGFAPASFLQEILGQGVAGLQIGQLLTNPNTPEGFTQAAQAGLDALSLLETGQIVLRNGAWLLSGNAGIDTISNQAIAVLAKATPDVEWKTLIIAPVALDICRDEVAVYTADKAILFPSAGVVPTAESAAILPGLVERLAICPDAPIFVEGHTDSDGAADANLSLSIRRAEAVVDAMVDLGMDPARLYAVGYGASLPIASNTTADGKRQNRRIVFSFEDAAQPVQ